METSNGPIEDSGVPACDSCKRRKMKCSKDMPTCQNCTRLEITCLYIGKKQKPGLKSGAVERLSQRLKVLERLLLNSDSSEGEVPQYHVHRGRCCSSECVRSEDRNEASDELATNGSSMLASIRNNAPEVAPEHTTTDLSRKRKRSFEEYNSTDYSRDGAAHDIGHMSGSTPAQGHVLDAVISVYFKTAHHWIPFLHERRFRARLENDAEKQKLSVVLHAMTYITIRLLPPSIISKEHGERIAKTSKNIVLLSAFDDLSVENLQALAMIAFDNLGGGESTKAWSLIGSLTRTVEYLQLTVENDDDSRQSLLKPLSFLEDPEDWTEAEERRRVFWNIFLLDRFCSITTGWNTSLTSDLVNRRLPCDGGFWTREEPVTTPFFGIWDKSAGRIGNSIAHIPDHYPSPRSRPENSPGSATTAGPVDVSTLGAFAYCVEATESLSQVTTFFLQQKVDFRSRSEVSSWLTRFKELDLRLVHWKMFLPQKWKDSNISREPSYVNMDPNLTLAHLTHDCSMILLHQHIAYPPADWKLVRLPSSCSAETCQLAAVEIANISHKYLKYTIGGIVNGQFAFCAFVAARLLLIHWRFTNTPLAPEFFNLVSSLKEMSRRWQGKHDVSLESPSFDEREIDLAAKYAQDLMKLHEDAKDDSEFCSRVLGYKMSGDKYEAKGMSQLPRTSARATDLGTPREQRTPSISSQSRPPPPLNIRTSHEISRPGTSQFSPGSHVTAASPSFGMGRPLQSPTMYRHPSLSHTFNGMPYEGYQQSEDELTAISHTLLGNEFMELDRIITLDGTNFSVDMSAWAGYNGGQVYNE